MGPIESWTKKTVYLLGKIDTCKYPEAETWHPESIDGRSYYKLCENFWWPFGTVPWEQFRPGLGPHFFYLILQKFLDFSGTWDLRYLIFLSMQFFQDFWFLAIFLVFQLKLSPKIDQNRKLLVRSIWAKFQNFEGFFEQYVAISWMLNQYKKL